MPRAARAPPARCAHTPAPDRPRPAGRRQLHRPRQLAIIGQQQQPLGVEVESPDRENTRHVRRQSAEESAGLSSRPSSPAPPACDSATAASAPDRAGGSRPRRCGLSDPTVTAGRCQDDAIDRDAAFGDPALRVAAGTKPGTRKPLGDPLRRGRQELGKSDSGMVIGGLRPVAEALVLTWGRL